MVIGEKLNIISPGQPEYFFGQEILEGKSVVVFFIIEGELRAVPMQLTVIKEVFGKEHPFHLGPLHLIIKPAKKRFSPKTKRSIDSHKLPFDVANQQQEKNLRKFLERLPDDWIPLIVGGKSLRYVDSKKLRSITNSMKFRINKKAQQHEKILFYTRALLRGETSMKVLMDAYLDPMVLLKSDEESGYPSEDWVAFNNTPLQDRVYSAFTNKMILDFLRVLLPHDCGSMSQKQFNNILIQSGISNLRTVPIKIPRKKGIGKFLGLNRSDKKGRKNG